MGGARAAIAFLTALATSSAAQAVDLQWPSMMVFEDPTTATRADHHMYADLAVTLDGVQGFGRVDHYVWSNSEGIQQQTYRAVVTVRVPSDVPGFETLEDARQADVRMRLAIETAVDYPTARYSPTVYIPYAECMLAVQPDISRHFVTFELLIFGHGDGVRVAKGVCDVDMSRADIQLGIPQMGFLDLLTGLVRNEADPDMAFMEGYCY